jgi:hypothetical protein
LTNIFVSLTLNIWYFLLFYIFSTTLIGRCFNEKDILPTVLIVSSMLVLLWIMTVIYTDVVQASNQATNNLSTLLMLMSLSMLPESVMKNLMNLV